MEVPRPPGKDVEDVARPESNFRGFSEVQKQNQLKGCKKILVSVLVLRACALAFSFVSFILIAVIPGFQLIDVTCYLFSVGLITMVYSVIQVGIKGDELRTGRDVIPHNVAVWIDFVGDQILAYMLLSCSTTGAMVTSAFRYYGVVHPVLDQASAAVAMSFLAFFSLAPAALFSGYKVFAVLSAN